MNIKGTVAGISRDWKTGKYQITLEMNEGNIQEIDKLTGVEISAEIKRFRNKRSKDANAMLWACIGEISKALGADKWDIYKGALKDYGKFTYICVKPEAVEAVKEQWRETDVIGEININGTPAVQLLCYFGSHLYDTKEFSRLLDGVISEMKDAGLDTPTSEEMQRALDMWEAEHGKKA